MFRRGLALVFYPLVPLLVLLLALALSCILAFFTVKLLGDSVPFQKIVGKFTQLLLVLSIFPAMKLLRIDKTELGFAARPIFFKQLAQGLALGLVTLLPVFFILYALNIHVMNTSHVWTIGVIFSKLSMALLSAILVSWIEEPLFRGILITGLSRKIPVALAIIVSAIYYGALHFLDNDSVVLAKDVHFWTGFALLGGAFANIFNPLFYSSLLSLVMVGIFLGVIKTQHRTSLGVCIGCHACWVWQIKMSMAFFAINTHTDYIYLVGNYDGIIGPLVTGWLFLAVLIYLLYRYLRSSNTA